MNLAEFTIKNYKSLRDVKIGFGSYTALIGENGSGKTSILEALYLFFKDISSIGGEPSPILKEATSWHNKNLPLEFAAKIVLSKEEARDIFPEHVLKKIIKKYGDAYRELTILRRIPKSGNPWETEYIKIAKITLVKGNAVVSPEDVEKLLGEVVTKRPTSKLKAYLFHPNASQSNLIGNRLVVLNNKAYPMDDHVDALVREGKIPFKKLSGLDHKEWAATEELELIDNPPAKGDIDSLLSKEAPLITSGILQNAQNKIVEVIKGKLKLIPATRNEQIAPGDRKSFLSKPTIVDPLTSLHSTDYQAWHEIGEAVEQLIKQRLDSVPTLSTCERDLRLPVQFIGGGQQETIGLLYQTYRASEPIIAIEEPEMHLHHSLSKELFKLLRQFASRKQLIVATHSEHFAEISESEESDKYWFLERKGKETKQKEIGTAKELLESFGVLGAEPSDRGYPNKILYVAGETERDILPIWAQKLGVNIDKVRIEALEGEYDKRKVPLAAKIVKNSQTTLFLMVDSHASDSVKRVKDVEEEKKLILEGTIEDNYPISTLIQVLNTNFGLKLTENDIDPELPRVEEIKKLLHDKRSIPKTKTFWKRPVGREVANQMSGSDIPELIKDFILKVAN